ncbi:hypothetical protein APHAL10511_004188 [Amanita phalloides]|nr:hypothetical protein APHAL10511_004188 [Amanita phalloides]
MTATLVGTLKNESENTTLYLYYVTKSPAGDDVETEVGALDPGESRTKEGEQLGVHRLKAEENGTRVTVIEFENGKSSSIIRHVAEVKGVKLSGSFTTHHI